MYEFIDVNEQQTATPLPTEAVSINGTYLETIVDGYRTLYVKGRESLGVNLNTYSVGTADGERLKNRRYPARTLTVGFQLLCDNAEDFRARFNQLNSILSANEADFIFNDERDKYFTGHAIMDAQVDEGTNNVTGEWKIYCAYPFKRSTEVKTLSSNDAEVATVEGNTATFHFEYGGVMPAKPLLRIKFNDTVDSGDCGYVAFANQDEAIVQLGNPDLLRSDETNRNATLYNKAFTDLSGWAATNMAVADITDGYWNYGQGATVKYAVPAEGTPNALFLHTDGATDFDFAMVHRFAVGQVAANRSGSLRVELKNGDRVVAGFLIDKQGSGTQGKVYYIVDGAVVGSDTVDLSYYNKHWGFCSATAPYSVIYPTTGGETVYGRVIPRGTVSAEAARRHETIKPPINGYLFTQSNLNSTIERTGESITFQLGELPRRTFKSSAIAGIAVYDTEITMTGDLGEDSRFGVNAVGAVGLWARKGVPFAQIPNVFAAGDIVEADCASANVYLYRNGGAIGHLSPTYGALGNDWEDFGIKVGENIIRAAWSDWVGANYKPEIEILFNEVFI